MKPIHIFSFLIILLFSSIFLSAQVKKGLTEADKAALEGVIVEKYYVSGPAEYIDTTGGAIPKGAITYRIYVDLKPGYSMQAVYGILTHELRIETTTQFFNNKIDGERTGDNIDPSKINMNSVALDSWVTIGAATKVHHGIPKTEDRDSSIIKRPTLNKADGLKAGAFRKVVYYGIDLNFFKDSTNTSSFTTNNGSWAVFGGFKSNTEDNKILIAQLTTTGKLSFELNIQVGTPTGESLQYVAKNPEGAEIMFDGLILKK